MSPVIDERIVEMQFDNQRFEKNISTSISSLDKLKSALNIQGVSRGLDNISSEIKKIDLSGIGSAVELISGRFSSMGVIATTILQDIAHKAFEVTQRMLNMVKSMTISQVAAGWDKYAEKTTSVQTIMAATGQTWEDDANALVQLNALTEQGFDPKNASSYLQMWKDVNSGIMTANQAAQKLGITVQEFNEKTQGFGDIAGLKYAGSQMDYVNEQMTKLNWFTDETSYSFTDMVNNIGKFTANNIPLSQAVTAMQGIANWAAISGQNAGAASRAMYNLAQAIGVGSVKLMDWKSIENANMATAEFKQKVLEVAAANGQLTASVDKTGKTIYKTKSGLEVSVQSFSQSLSEGWFDSKTLISTLEQYGAFTDKLYEFSEASGLTATEILDLIDAEKEGTISQAQYDKIMKETGMTLDEVKEALGELGSEENEFGRKTFQAAQEAKTFQDAIDATKDAASTKWMNIFENIFGDYEKAKSVWTGFANFLYDTLVAPLESLEEISEILGELNAVGRIARGFGYIFSFLKGDGVDTFGLFDSIAKGFRQIFPPIDDLKLAISKVLTAFTRWGKSIQLTHKQVVNLRSAARGLARVFKIGVLDSIVNLWNATEPLRSSLSRLAGALTNFFINIGKAANGMHITALSGEILGEICKKLASFVDKVSEAFDGLSVDTIRSALNKLASIMDVVKQSLINIWNATEPLRSAFAGLGKAVLDLIGRIFESADGFELTEIKADGLRDICEKLAGIIDKVSEALNNLSIDSIKEKFEKVADTIIRVRDGFLSFIEGIKNFSLWKSLGAAIDWIKQKFQILKDFLSKFDFGKAVKGGFSVGIFALIGTAVIKLIKLIKNPIKALDGIKEKLEEFLNSIGNLLGNKKIDGATEALKKVATSILILAAALLVLGFVDYDNAIIGIGIIGIALAAFFANMQKLEKIKASTVAKLAGTMIALSASMLAFSVALVVLSGAVALFALVAKMDTVWKGLGVMAVSIGILAVALYALSKISPKAFVGAAALLVLSASLIVLAGAMALFALVAGMKNVWKGLGLMAASLGILIVALFALSKISPMMVVGAISIIVLASALIVLAGAMALFALVAGMDNVWKGLGLMAASLGILVVALLALSFMSPMIIVGAASILILSAALIVLAGVLAAFALIAGMTTAWDGLLMLGITLGILTIALIALGATAPAVLAGSAALLVAAAACLVLAVAVGVVSLVLPLLADGLLALSESISASLAVIGEGILAFGTSITNLVVVIAEGIGTAIVAITVSIGVGLEVLAASISAALSSISEGLVVFGEGIGAAVLGIATGIGASIETIAGSIGTSIEVLASSVSTALSSISEGITAFGEGIGAAALGIAAGIGASIETIAGSIGTSIETIATSVSTSLTTLGEGISGFGEGVAGLITPVMDAISTGVQELVGSVGQGIADGINAISSSITNFSTGLGDVNVGITDFGTAIRSLKGIDWVGTGAGIVTISDSLKKLKVGDLSSKLEEASSGVVTACTEMTAAIEKSLTASMSLVDTAGSDIVVNMATGLKSKIAEAKAAGSTVGNNVVTGLRNGTIASRTVGMNAAQGFIDGFLTKELTAGEAGRRLAKKALEKAKEELDEHSPSKAFFKIGNYGSQGFINGLLSLEDSVGDAGKSISKEALSSVVDAMAGISEIIDSNPEITPIVRPVLDSDSIDAGLRRISNAQISTGINGQLTTDQTNAQLQNANSLLTNALANVDSANQKAENSHITPENLREFVDMGNQILMYLQDGHDIFFDDGTFAGRINRRLGSL